MLVLVDFSDEFEELSLLDTNVDLVSELSPPLLHPADSFSELVELILKLSDDSQSLLLLLHCSFEYCVLLVS